MDNSLLAFVEVRLDWAAHHLWQGGDAMVGATVGAYTLWLVLDGAVEVSAAGRQWRLLPGTALLLPGNLARDVVTPHGAEWLSVGLHANLFGRIDLLQVLALPAVWQPETPERHALEMWMRQIVGEWIDAVIQARKNPIYLEGSRVHLPHREPRDAISALISAGLGRALFGLCWRALGGETNLGHAHPSTPPWLTRTLQHIAREPGTEVHELAGIAGFSPAHFRRTFHTWVGESPQAYVTRCRLDEARRLLVTTNLIVNVVAERVGFESLSYFTRLFKQQFGVSPARYRHAARQSSV